MKAKQHSKGAPLDPELIEALRAAVERDGIGPTCTRLRLSRMAVMTGLAGLNVYPGTESLLRVGLAIGGEAA